MIVCPNCRNKRCPRATFHLNSCTGSNEPGQPGSRYGIGSYRQTFAEQFNSCYEKFNNLKKAIEKIVKDEYQKSKLEGKGYDVSITCKWILDELQNALNNDILPCPFCGGEVDPHGWLDGYGNEGPECEQCGATARSLDDWNRRV